MIKPKLLILLVLLFLTIKAYAIDSSYFYYERKQCTDLLTNAKGCQTDSDCTVILNSNCTSCSCYTAVNKNTDLSRIEPLMTKIRMLKGYDGIKCEACSPQTPKVVCQGNQCVASYAGKENRSQNSNPEPLPKINQSDEDIERRAQEFLSTKDKSKIWPCHFLGRRREYCHMERLGNLGAIPKPFGFTISCLPVKVRNAGAGWARVVAIM